MINSLEVIVRPNIAPDVRPPKLPVKITTDDPNDTEIIGARGQCIDLDHRHDVRVTFQEKQAEQFRIFDRVRITNPNRVPASALNTPKGTTPSGVRNYADVEVTHYLQYKNEFGILIVEKFRKPDHLPSRGIFVLEENIKRSVS